MSNNAMSDEELTQAIGNIDDATAIRVLATFAEVHARAGEGKTEWTPELAGALCREYDVAPEGEAASEGELARQTLLLLCQDEKHREPILALIKGPGPGQTRFIGLDPVSGALLITGVILALQSHIEFERDKDGRWSFKFKREPTEASIITPLIKKLIALMSGGPPSP